MKPFFILPLAAAAALGLSACAKHDDAVANDVTLNAEDSLDANTADDADVNASTVTLNDTDSATVTNSTDATGNSVDNGTTASGNTL